MDLRRPIIKAFSIGTFLVLIAAPEEGASGSTGTARATEPVEVVPPPPLPAPPMNGSTRRTIPTDATCGEGMILVDGEYCPDAEQVCVKWVGDPPPYQNLRCAEYAKPARCKGTRVHLRYCVDREEFAETDAAGSAEAVLPMVSKNWIEAKALCEGRGARLCKEAEWTFACEGPEMSPYPYGWKRDSTLCNFDKTDLGGPMEKLKDWRAPLDAYPECMSPFGAHNMVGNVDEWVEREGGVAPNRSALRGGWWLPGRNRCRAATTAHGEEYSGKQVGFRCCKDAP